MEDKKQDKNFRFVLSLKNEKISEIQFDANQYNPVVRYSVNIRSMIPKIIADIQSILMRSSSKLSFTDDHGYNSLDYYRAICDINRLNYLKLLVPAPSKAPVNPVNGKTFAPRNGTEFKFGLHINDNPIVERNFYVDNYNPEARFSQELDETLKKIVGNITEHIQKIDQSRMWDDYTIINVYDLNIQQVRELSPQKREEFLQRTSDYNFVDGVRNSYNKQAEVAA